MRKSTFVLSLVPLFALVYIFYQTQTLIFVSVLLNDLPRLILAFGLGILIVARTVRTRVTLKELSVGSIPSYTYGVVLFGLAYSLFIWSSYGGPELLLRWFSLVTFVSAYVVSVYGKRVGWHLIPIFISLAPVFALPLPLFLLGYSILSISVIRSFLPGQNEPPCSYHLGLNLNSCPYCGWVAQRQTPQLHWRQKRSLGGIGIIGLLTVSALVISFPLIALNSGIPMVATYGYDGIVWTPLIEASEIEGVVIDSSFTPEGLEPPIIDLPESWILLQSDEVSLESFSGSREVYQVGNSSIEVLLLQGVIPHLAAGGDLAYGTLRFSAYLTTEGNENDGLIARDQLTAYAESIDGGLGSSPYFTESLFLISNAVILVIPLLAPVLGIGVLLSSAIFVKRSDSISEHRLLKISALPNNLQPLAFSASSSSTKKRTGRDIHDRAVRLGYAGGIDEFIKDIKVLAELKFIISEEIIQGGKTRFLWIRI